MESVFRWMAALPDARVLGDLKAARDFLASREDVRDDAIGITGFCMGGQYALMAACSRSDFAACVSWYGMLRYGDTSAIKPESPLDMAERLSCPFIGLFGEDDAIIALTDVEELRRRLARTPHEVEVRTYAGAGHAFFNDSRPETYRAVVARDAWQRAIAFLRKHLAVA